MSPPSKSKPHTPALTQPDATRPLDVSWVEASNAGHRPHGTDAFLLSLADQLGEALPLNQAFEVAVSALAAQLPNCRVELHESSIGEMAPSSDADPRPHAGYPSSTQLLERCSWPLSDDPKAKRLVLILPEGRSLRDVSQALEMGTYVAQWLRLATRSEQLRLQLAKRADELQELRQRLIQAEKLASYGQLVASSLHDLNNPLTALIAYADYLVRKHERHGGLDADDRERLGRIHEAAQAVMRQTRRLVEHACPARNPLDQVSLVDVIRRALTLCEHEFVRARLEVRLNAQDDLSRISGHAEQLTQLFVNLFTNAAQAARPKEGWLRIDACEVLEESRIIVRVSDNGTGINPSDIERVFDAFYTTKCGSGCGLGLAIVRDIVEHHGGQVSVASTPNAETVFTIVLPCAQRGQGLRVE